MVGTNFTNEAINILNYIKGDLVKKHPTNKITIEYFLLAVLENEDSTAYQILSRSTLTSTLSGMRDWLSRVLSENKCITVTDSVTYDTIYDRCVDYGKANFNVTMLNSGHMLLAVLKQNETIATHLKEIGITYEQLYANLKSILPKSEKAKSAAEGPAQQKGVVDELLIDMNKLAANGKIDEVVGNEEIIAEIFSTFAKRDRNNVIVVGDSGVGKTATVSHIANLLNKGKVPPQFKNKKLMKLDFMELVSGAVLRGNFEAKFKAIVEDATKKNGYIFFIDDLQSILSDKSKFGEINTENMLDMILMERHIQFIATMDNRSYSTYIEANPSLKRRFKKLQMEEKGVDDIIPILNKGKEKYEKFHNVVYTDDAVETCVKLIRQYAKDAKLPDYAFDVLDEAGARLTMSLKEDDRIAACNKEIDDLTAKMHRMSNGYEKYDSKKYDTMCDLKIQLMSKLKILEKEKILNDEPSEVTQDDIKQAISAKVKIPVTELDGDEISRLKSLEERLKQKVVGQDAAVGEVCRVVKRQRIGIANKNRPAVLFFAGMTGMGKTYLAKKLAQEVFGDEKSLVRLDMSEYSDKMSVTKLYGASAGYVGYDKGGVLTEAIKKNNHCVLLLDEMEKASEDVHNVFLQLFDDGRLTDNMGVTVDFSNVIVIMTSNVGAKEISEKGNGIGFVKNDSDNNEASIMKAMRNKFTPEFINRVDKVVVFNKLSEADVRKIISLELENLDGRLADIGYSLGESFKSDEFIDTLYNKVREKSNYGARPVIHVIRQEVEDKITDYIIDSQPKKGQAFETFNVF